MRLSTLIVLSVFAAAPALAFGQTTGPVSRPAAKIAELLGQLASDDWQVRQKAQDQLVDIGPEAATPLRELLGRTTDEEVRTRVEAALKKIRDDDPTLPTLVDLHVSEMPADQALAKLAREVGTRLDVAPNRKGYKRVTINASQQPFWVVVKEVCRQAGLSQDRMSEKLAFIEDDAAFGNMPAVCSGPVMIVPRSATRHRSVGFGNLQTAMTGVVFLGIYVDPKVRVPDRTVTAQEIVDDKGNNLLMERDSHNPSNGLIVPWMREADGDEQIAFKDIREGGQRIARFSGVVTMTVYKTEKWEIPNILAAKNVSREVGPWTFTVVSAERQGADCVVTTVSKGNGHDVGKVNEVLLTLVDAAGHESNHEIMHGIGGRSRSDVVYTISLPEGFGEPVKLIWEIPSHFQEMKIPFEFKDLPLPPG